MAKKFLSALLAVLMVISIVPMTAMADTTTYAETTPTLVVGMSKNFAEAGTDIGAVLSAEISATGADAHNKNLLWFAMTGLGTDKVYKLSVKGSKGELLGKEYATHDSNDVGKDKFKGSPRRWIYVSLEDKAEDGTGAQIDSKMLEAGNYTVQLLNANTNTPLVTKSITLSKTGDEGSETWSCTQNDADNSKIKFEKPAQDVFTTLGNKALGDIQTGKPEFDVADDGTVKVTGATLKYVSDWTTFSSNDIMKHGYYAVVSVPRVLRGNVIKNWEKTGSKTPSIPTPATSTLTNSDGLQDKFTEYNNSYCDTIIYLGETAEEAKASRPSMKLTYGTLVGQTYTFDFSGMKFSDETITAKAAENTGLTGPTVNALQNDIQATTNAETKTITVTGTSYYVENYTQFDSTLKDGNFVALTVENAAGVPMQLYSPANKNDTSETNASDGYRAAKNGWKYFPNKDTVIVRLDGYRDVGYKVKIKVGRNLTEGTDWTIDCSGVDMRGQDTTRLEVDAMTGVVLGKKGTDLQSNITSTQKSDGKTTTITFRGESKYVTGYTEFDSSTADNQHGNYLALKFTKPKNATSVKLEGKELISNGTFDDTYVVILNGSKGYKNNLNMTVTTSGGNSGTETKNYVLDFTNVKRLPADIKAVTKKGGTYAGMDKLSVKYDSTSKKIVLSGLVEAIKGTDNMYTDVDMRVKIDDADTYGKDIKVRFTESGDKLTVTANPASYANNTFEFDTSMLLIKSANATDDVAVAKEEPTVSKDIPTDKQEAAKGVADALNKTNVPVEKAILEKYAYVESNSADAKSALVSKADGIVTANADKVPQRLKEYITDAKDDSGSVQTVVQTYAKIEVAGVDTNEKNEVTSFDISITPMARTVVTYSGDPDKIKLFDETKDAQANSTANAIAVGEKEIAISESTDVTLALPESYKADKAYITHKKSSGEEFHYTGKIAGSSPRTLTFTSTHGFSSFTITDTEPVKSKDATLKSVKVGGVEAVLDGTAYTATMPKGTDLTKLTLNLTANSSMAKITSVNGGSYTEGMTVNLSGKTATIIVTAEDGATKNTYTLTAKLSTGEPSDEYHDIPSGGMGDWVKNAINYGLMGNIGTNSDGKLTFGPKESVLRKEFAVMVARADVIAKNADIKDKDAADKYLKANYISEKLSFSDISGQADTYIAAIEYCKKNNIISGYENGTFKPNDKVSRTQAASMVVGWLKLDDTKKTNPSSFKDWDKVDWAQGKVNAVITAGIMTGKSNTEFGTGELTREEIAVIIVRSYWKVAGITVTE